MTKEKLIQEVLKNPEPALTNGALTCHNNSDRGRLEPWGDKWMYVSYGHGSDFEVTDEFIKEVIWNNRRKLWELYE